MSGSEVEDELADGNSQFDQSQTFTALARETSYFEDSSFVKEYSLQDNIFRRGCQVLTDDVVNVCKRVFSQLTSKGVIAFWKPRSPVSQRPLPDMAFSLHTDYYITIYALYGDGADDSSHCAWVVNYIGELEKHFIDTYLGVADFQVRDTKFSSDEAGKN